MSSIFLQGIAGYYSGQDVYDTRAQRLREVGFVRLQSDPNEWGEILEVWMLTSHSMAKGALQGKSEEDIVHYCTKLGVGSIEYGGKTLGLSPG